MTSRASLGKGFTLIEVLLALAIIAIALTALLKSTAQTIESTNRIKEKMIGHWVAMQGITMIQLHLVQVNLTQENTQVTTLMGMSWYWRTKLDPTPFKNVQKITLSISLNPAGPFHEELTAFRYLS